MSKRRYCNKFSSLLYNRYECNFVRRNWLKIDNDAKYKMNSWVWLSGCISNYAGSLIHPSTFNFGIHQLKKLHYFRNLLWSKHATALTFCTKPGSELVRVPEFYSFFFFSRTALVNKTWLVKINGDIHKREEAFLVEQNCARWRTRG